MHYLYMVLSIITIPCKDMLKRSYGRRGVGCGYLFSAILAFAGACFFTVVAFCIGGFSYEIGVLPYSAMFGVGYVLCSCAATLALGIGSLAITSLIISYSLMLPTVYGILALHEPFGVYKVVGLCLLVASLYLINVPTEKKGGGEGRRFSFRWLLLCAVAFFLNGFISIVQNEQLRRFGDTYRNEFMVVALLIGILCLVPLVIVFERRGIVENARVAATPAVLAGVVNAALNLFVMITASTIARSVFFPVLSAGSTVLTYLISLIFYKERYTLAQHLGVALGVGALIFLNL